MWSPEQRKELAVADGATVTAAEIARLAGVGRAAVSNWRRRHGDFPRPVGGTSTSPEFALFEIEEWLQAQGKLHEPLPAEDLLWQKIRAVADARRLAEIIADLGDYLVGLARRDQTAGKAPASRNSIHAVTDAVADLAATQGPAETYEFLVARYLDANFRRVTTTSGALADLMAALAGVDEGAVFDPACGAGAILLAVVRRGGTKIAVAGQEIDDPLARIAAARLALAADTEVDVRSGDSLHADAFRDFQADAVVCHPPFNERNWMGADAVVDPRWEYGEPPATESELAWVQHALTHVRPGGRVVLLLPPGVASRRSGRRIRAELVRRGALHAVIALPAGLDRLSTLPLHVWLLRRPDGDAPASLRVLVADMADLGDQHGPDDQPHSLADETLRVVRAFEANPEAESAAAHRYRAVAAIELLDDEVDLTPVRYLAAPPRPDSGEQYAQTRHTVEAMLQRLRRHVPAVPAAGSRREWVTVSVAELARAGALTIVQAPLQPRVEPSADGRPVLTARDVLSHSDPSDRAVAQGGPGAIEIELGDVVVASVAGRLGVSVATEGGALLGPNLYLLRPSAQVLDPHFLAGFLRNSSNTRLAGRTLPGARLDVRRAAVPRLPLAEQQRYGAAFAELAAFERELVQVAVAGRELVASGIDGLTDGGLAPPVDVGDGQAASA